AFPRNAKPPWRAIASEVSGRGIPIVGAENWVREPLSYYLAVRVPEWSHLTTRQRAAHMVFVCRVPKCAAPDDDGSARTRTPVGTWHWGVGHEIVAFDLAEDRAK
ncbi:MAG TPA: hypothetical protein VJ891_20060, partial [Casimicrobiaceae bacterium]|nr:hypothetical protein [Casimicrobiaceae bacterium]